jgi:hypothetical protein
MATTTPNYGWTVPTSTDLVKDGATAIETLGDAIDASMNTALGTKKAGMVLLNTTSFSGVTSISAPASTFSANYVTYKVILTLSAASAGDVRLRMRTGSTDTTGSVYTFNYLMLANSSQTTYDYVRSAGYTTGLTIGVIATTQEAILTLDIQNPFATKNTAILAQCNNLGGTDTQTLYGGGRVNDTTSYDSISIFNLSGGNIAGTLRIYGVNQ